MNKWYVWSGELAVEIVAATPMDAAVKALGRFGNGKTLDPRYFVVDLPGFRTCPENCSKDGFVVDVTEVIRAAGFVFEDGEEEGC